MILVLVFCIPNLGAMNQVCLVFEIVGAMLKQVMVKYYFWVK